MELYLVRLSGLQAELSHTCAKQHYILVAGDSSCLLDGFFELADEMKRHAEPRDRLPRMMRHDEYGRSMCCENAVLSCQFS